MFTMGRYLLRPGHQEMHGWLTRLLERSHAIQCIVTFSDLPANSMIAGLMGSRSRESIELDRNHVCDCPHSGANKNAGTQAARDEDPRLLIDARDQAMRVMRGWNIGSQAFLDGCQHSRD